MLTAKHRAIIACIPLGMICAGYGWLADSVIRETPADQWVDNMILSILPGLFMGAIAGRIGPGVASWLRAHNRGLVLVELEKLLLSGTPALALLPIAYFSRIAAVIALGTGLVALWSVRQQITDERFTLANRDS